MTVLLFTKFLLNSIEVSERGTNSQFFELSSKWVVDQDKQYLFKSMRFLIKPL